ncbi:MAG: adenylate/guanylate cyclase domain-containing protein [Gammaproteobacteria bacterium]|nr:adenylate/guanylate cyclase domain-containing protein [Gammaproteobacteria bacterium]
MGHKSTIVDRLITDALANQNYERVFARLCEMLVDSGLPLFRSHLAIRTLHPLLASVDMTWWRGRGLEVNPREHAPAPQDDWLRSPLFWMIENRQREFRQRLKEPSDFQQFPVLQEFRDAGATDYLAVLTPFGDPETAFERQDGILTSWVSDAPDGFSDSDVAFLRDILPYVGLVAKLSKHEHTAQNVASAYLGEDVGRRVLEGQIRLGDVDRIPAVVWYTDLRGSTALAQRLPVADFLRAVNAYFDCTAGAVLEHGGEVLRFIGDAVLAVFPIGPEVSAASAAERAMAAAHGARERMNELNLQRAHQAQEPLAFGLGLHIGEVLYGNIGVPTRLEFSVIGSAANEVSRLESLTKEVRETVLVSAEFVRVLPGNWRALGKFEANGVAGGLEVFAPAEIG